MSRQRGAKIYTLMNHMTRRGIKFQNRNKDKYNLFLMGYFHGYQNCRFTVNKTKKGVDIENLRYIRFKYFSQVEKIYHINSKMNSLFYPMITQVITSLKNYIIYFLVNNGGWYLKDIFNNCMNNKHYHSSVRKINDSKSIVKSFKNSAYSNQPYNLLMKYKNVAKHHKDVPIWALFEVINLWQLAKFCGCLYHDTEANLEQYLGLTDKNHNNNGGLLSRHLNILLKLRDAVAHNKIIFDCRFRGTDGVRLSVEEKLQKDSHVKPIRFNSIVDYFILLAYYQHLFKVNPNIIKDETKELEHLLYEFKYTFYYNRFYNAFGKKPLRKLKAFYFN